MTIQAIKTGPKRTATSTWKKIKLIHQPIFKKLYSIDAI